MNKGEAIDSSNTMQEASVNPFSLLLWYSKRFLFLTFFLDEIICICNNLSAKFLIPSLKESNGINR